MHDDVRCDQLHRNVENAGRFVGKIEYRFDLFGFDRGLCTFGGDGDDRFFIGEMRYEADGQVGRNDRHRDLLIESRRDHRVRRKTKIRPPDDGKHQREYLKSEVLSDDLHADFLRRDAAPGARAGEKRCRWLGDGGYAVDA